MHFSRRIFAPTNVLRVKDGTSTQDQTRMRTSIGIRRIIVATGLAATLVGQSQHVLGGQPTASPPATTPIDTKVSGYNLEIIDGKLVLPGGKVEATLGNVVDALRDQYTEANLVLAPGLAKLKVADLKLRAGRLLDELEGLRVATGGKFEVQAPASPVSTVDPTTGLPREGAKPNVGLFVLRDLRQAGPRERVVEAFNIGPYLEWLGFEWLRKHPNPNAQQKHDSEDEALREIEEIIESTITDFSADSGEVQKPTWQYHRGATLLVVIGNLDSVEIARKIVNALPGMSTRTDSARAGRYGPGSPSPEDRAAAEDAFRKRYGLAPRAQTTNPSLNTEPGQNTPLEMEHAAKAAKAEEAFRTRYGLAPATSPPAQPATPSEESDSPKK